jgi:hypothetical protein
MRLNRSALLPCGAYARRATAILAVLAVFVMSNSVLAADYDVELGAETVVGKDAGTLRCVFDDICPLPLPELGLRVSIFVSRGEPGRATVHLYGDDLSCCYFTEGRDSTEIDSAKPVSRVPFFRGAGARGGLFIQNERAGTLFLRFRFLRDKI